MPSRPTVSHLVILILVALLATAGCIAPTQPASEFEPTPGEIRIVESWARPSPQVDGNGAAYAVILNGLERPVRLSGAKSPAAEAVELHETSVENDVMRMVHHPEGFEIGSGDALVLEPGGKHVMLIGLENLLAPGDTIEVQFFFEGINPITIQVPVSEPRK